MYYLTIQVKVWFCLLSNRVVSLYMCVCVCVCVGSAPGGMDIVPYVNYSAHAKAIEFGPFL